MATKIMKSAILPASWYKDDWLSHRNQKNHSSGVNYNTRAFAKSLGSLMPRIAMKNRGPNNLWHLTVFCYFFVFLTNQAGFKIQQILRNLRKLGAATIFRFFVTFLLFLYLPDGASEFNKFWENCEKSCSQRFAAIYDFSSLLCCSQSAGLGFRFRLIPRKVRKIVPHFTIFLYTSSSLRRKADVKLIALVSHWKRSFTRIESCNQVNISAGHLAHNASFNIVPFKHLHSSTGYLHHSALKPRHPHQTPQAHHEMQPYVMQVKYLCRPTTRFPQCLTRMCVGHILILNIQFNEQSRKITCPLLFARG